MNLRRKFPVAAFTLIEMAMAISISLGLAVGLLALIGQQIEFSRRIADFQFLRDEAPQINTRFLRRLSAAPIPTGFIPTCLPRSPGNRPLTRSGRLFSFVFSNLMDRFGGLFSARVPTGKEASTITWRVR